MDPRPDAAAGLGARARALRANALPRRPCGMSRSAVVDGCIDKAGFLGRWFSEQPDPVTTLVLWGLRP